MPLLTHSELVPPDLHCLVDIEHGPGEVSDEEDDYDGRQDCGHGLLSAVAGGDAGVCTVHAVERGV